MIGMATYFYEPKIGVLQANCKCASLWTERELRAKKIDNPLKVLRQTGCNFYSTYRRPRNWYMSGYRYWCQHNQYSLTFTEHLKRCIELKAEFRKLDGYLLDHDTPTTENRPHMKLKRPGMYDYHTWIDPWMATQLMLGEKGKGIEIHWFDTDQTAVYHKFVKAFKGATLNTNRSNVSKTAIPKRTEKQRVLINKLDDWSRLINTA